ncbi:alanine racemase [Bosea sp. 2KB_26]|uniref:alanine racemase n=1 Tax=Bosea sp. 2KB_26 TaxID=3237475 RepID=UPI003F908FCF
MTAQVGLSAIDPGHNRTDCRRHDLARLLRPSWAELDFGALSRNVAATRSLVGRDVRIYFVCKGDGFGFGAAAVASAAERAGVDGFCAGSPDEVVSIRSTGTTLPVLLFASTTPGDLPAAARLGATVTVQSMADMDAVLAAGERIEVFVEVDCGLGRYGLRPKQWPGVLQRLRAADHVRVRGLYSHLSTPDDPGVSRQQAELFRQAAADAAAAGHDDLILMLASSRVVLAYPDMLFNAVDPGRLIYGGGLDENWMEIGGLSPLLTAVKSRVIQVQEHPPGTVLGIGYGAPIAIERGMRTAVAPIGFWDGLNHIPPLGEVLIHGRRCPVLGRRTFQHSVIDVTGIADVAPGDEVVVLGRQGTEKISIHDLAGAIGITVIELVPRLARSLPHVYVGQGQERDGRRG